jgi:ribonuclease VapC
MVVDSSAIMAMLFDESEARQLYRKLLEAPRALISAATFLETAIVVDQRIRRPEIEFDDFIQSTGMDIVPVTASHARLAREAYRRFGRGNHRATLNFGDCFSYALAKVTDEPLLSKGNDFQLTDIRLA